jgi:probable HAF family extracellular repeat protein
MTTYRFTTLANVGAIAFGINNVGQIVGSTGGNNPNGFLFQNGSLTTLPIPPIGLIDPPRGILARGISDTGTIVGSFLGQLGGTHGFTFSGGSYKLIPNLFQPPVNVVSTDVHGITGNGALVVGSFLPGPQGFFYGPGNPTVAATVDNFAPTGETELFGVNSAAVIVGTYTDTGGVPHGFVFDGSVFRDLIPAPPTFMPRVHFTDINDHGQIVGYASDNFGGDFGFVYSYTGTNYAGGTYGLLAVPGGPFIHSTPFGINNNGQIVGSYVDAQGTHAFLAIPN